TRRILLRRSIAREAAISRVAIHWSLWRLPTLTGQGDSFLNVMIRVAIIVALGREASVTDVAKDDAATGLLCRHADLRTGAIGSRRRSAGSTPGLTSYAGLRSEIRALSSGR